MTAEVKPLSDWTTKELLDELAGRPDRLNATVECDCEDDEPDCSCEWDLDSLEIARFEIGRGDLAEAAIWLSRTHSDLDGLPALVARVMRGA